MMRKILITGNSSGLGLALTGWYLDHGWQVFGLSRRGCPLTHSNLIDQIGDLGCGKDLQGLLGQLRDTPFDLVILNAGLLGEIKLLRDTSMQELQEIMTVNVWANKVLLDDLLARTQVRQVVAISSGAAVNCNKGWGAYSLSKATLNALIKLYAAEHEQTHFTALAPGLVDTEMQEYLCNAVDSARYPAVKKLKAARGGPEMPTAAEAAKRVAQLICNLRSCRSGEFVDIRSLPNAVRTG